MHDSISVIIPTYNRKENLIRALDSVVHQSHPADEIIVVDDGSGDGTKQLIAEQYKQVIYLYHNNRGVSYSRNAGVARAQGRWLAFLDSDDEWLLEKLSLQLAALRESPHIPLCHTGEIWIRNGVRVNAMNKHKKRGGNIYLNCLPLCVISPSSVMMSRDLFLQIGGFDENLPACEDYDLWLRICADTPVLFIEEPLIRKYGGHADQLSKRFWGMDRFRVQALEKLIDSKVLREDLLRATRKLLIEKCEILVNGAIKRNNGEMAKYYQSKISHYG